MNFLVDHQLPPALAKFLQSCGHNAQHVRELGFKEAEDSVIWRYAMLHDMAVVSKEEDFYYLATSPGNGGKLVWVRMGNCRKQHLLELFQIHLPRIVEALKAGSQIVELR